MREHFVLLLRSLAAFALALVLGAALLGSESETEKLESFDSLDKETLPVGKANELGVSPIEIPGSPLPRSLRELYDEIEKVKEELSALNREAGLRKELKELKRELRKLKKRQKRFRRNL